VAVTKQPGVRKADRLADEILRRIVSGELPVGSILPREDELAASHGVNRSVVREAVKLLEVHRLVHPVRKRGTEVLNPYASMSPEVLRAMLTPSPGLYDRRVLEGLLEIRANLDVMMYGLAAARRTAADLGAMDAALVAMADALAAKDPIDYLARADTLLLAIARSTRNPMFEMLSAWNRVVLRELEPIALGVRSMSAPHLQALTALVEKVRKKDVEGARALVTAFHEWATPRLLAAAHADASLTQVMEKVK
jgi:DNA-binding FadR family transcriptional regulator